MNCCSFQLEIVCFQLEISLFGRDAWTHINHALFLPHYVYIRVFEHLSNGRQTTDVYGSILRKQIKRKLVQQNTIFSIESNQTKVVFLRDLHTEIVQNTESRLGLPINTIMRSFESASHFAHFIE